MVWYHKIFCQFTYHSIPFGILRRVNMGVQYLEAPRKIEKYHDFQVSEENFFTYVIKKNKRIFVHWSLFVKA